MPYILFVHKYVLSVNPHCLLIYASLHCISKRRIATSYMVHATAKTNCASLIGSFFLILSVSVISLQTCYVTLLNGPLNVLNCVVY